MVIKRTAFQERMGADLHAEVDRPVLEDLEHYGVSGADLKIDWSSPAEHQ